MERVNSSLEVFWKDRQKTMRHLKELQNLVKICGEEEIVKILTDASMLSDTRRAFGDYLFSPTEVLTHRSVLSYRIKKILEKNGVMWAGDPMDINVTRVLMQVRKHIATKSKGLNPDLPASSPDVNPPSNRTMQRGEIARRVGPKKL